MKSEWLYASEQSIPQLLLGQNSYSDEGKK